MSPLFDDYFLSVMDIHAPGGSVHPHAVQVVVGRIVACLLRHGISDACRGGASVVKAEREGCGVAAAFELQVGTEVWHGVARFLYLQELSLALAEGIEAAGGIASDLCVLHDAHHPVAGFGIHARGVGDGVVVLCLGHLAVRGGGGVQAVQQHAEVGGHIAVVDAQHIDNQTKSDGKCYERHEMQDETDC